MSTIIVQEGNAGTVIVESSTTTTVTIGPVETTSVIIGPLTANGSFEDLTNTPSSLSGEANNFVVVNATGTGLVFTPTVPPPYVTTYDYITAYEIEVASITYREVQRLTTPIRVAGVYETTLSMVWSLDNKTRSSYFRFSQDNGVTWVEVILQPTTTSEKLPVTLVLPEVHTEGVHEIIVQARQENIVDLLMIHNLSIIFESKVS